MDVKAIIDILGGPSKVAKHLKSDHARGHISRAAVCQWKQIPAEHCMELARLSDGLLTVYDLRPDVFGSAPEAGPAEVSEKAA